MEAGDPDLEVVGLGGGWNSPDVRDHMQKLLQYAPILTSLLAGLGPQALPAQSSRLSCAERLAVYQSTSASERIGKPLWALRTCPEEGPDAVAELWFTPPEQADKLASLGNLSALMRDARVLRALLAAVEPSTGFQVEAQTVAASALVGLAMPCMTVGRLQDLTVADSILSVAWLASGPNMGIAAGKEPIGDGVLPEVIAALDRAGRGSSEQLMRARARGLAQALRILVDNDFGGCNWAGSHPHD